jgi:hypothetical protein
MELADSTDAQSGAFAAAAGQGAAQALEPTAAAATAAEGLINDPENAFEAERARIMAKNRQVMQDMGVEQAADSLKALKQPKHKYTGLKRPKPQVGCFGCLRRRVCHLTTAILPMHRCKGTEQYPHVCCTFITAVLDQGPAPKSFYSAFQPTSSHSDQ